ncbi:hypothetical protein NUH86_12600 [Sphingobium sp. JS3065]|uniref:hypothetical protein n=1 Tax=Sphingobium sp. JS3065 TaxID=2970925 RepID=UPI0022653D34|nr:hypothetical protein [Sphingobium sp. JS3065]UZW54350.1 hypothetical protein NUH86_12600 [Sphingobium sp. JS3065]
MKTENNFELVERRWPSRGGSIWRNNQNMPDVRHLRYAVATTTCRKTVAVMQEMLREAEDQLQSCTASNDVLLKKALDA